MWYQPGHQALNIKSINTLTGHQALNIRAKAHRASSPQRKSKSSQGIKPSTSNEYAWTQKQTCEKDARTRIGYAVTMQLARRVNLFAVASCDRQHCGNRPVFSQKPNFSSTQIPNLIGNLTYD
ncbi:hypothetical protein MTR_3g045270 [Medicago truncatula]|uniref:Uncharacterized protein n=1 Tax=Medicago truncatula TaxID=3880 RepID=A0A072UWT6_MEDTR|nr:hypothetical protein MTR_3g045270 [Medicago truncatula]